MALGLFLLAMGRAEHRLQAPRLSETWLGGVQACLCNHPVWSVAPCSLWSSKSRSVFLCVASGDLLGRDQQGSSHASPLAVCWPSRRYGKVLSVSTRLDGGSKGGMFVQSSWRCSHVWGQEEIGC